VLGSSETKYGANVDTDVKMTLRIYSQSDINDTVKMYQLVKGSRALVDIDRYTVRTVRSSVMVNVRGHDVQGPGFTLDIRLMDIQEGGFGNYTVEVKNGVTTPGVFSLSIYGKGWYVFTLTMYCIYYSTVWIIQRLV
jgi:hypothetical protein